MPNHFIIVDFPPIALNASQKTAPDSADAFLWALMIFGMFGYDFMISPSW